MHEGAGIVGLLKIQMYRNNSFRAKYRALTRARTHTIITIFVKIIRFLLFILHYLDAHLQ